MDELEKAEKEARSFPNDKDPDSPGMRYIGMIEDVKRFYFYECEGEYYYDTDFAREFRRTLKEKNRPSRRRTGRV